MRPRRREDPAVGVQRELDRRALPAALRRGEEVLAPVLGPLDRAAELERGERDQRRLDRQRALGAEAAADVGDDHADRGLVQAEHLRELRPRPVRALRRGPDRQPLASGTAIAPRGSIGAAARRGITCSVRTTCAAAANAPATSPARFSQRAALLARARVDDRAAAARSRPRRARPRPRPARATRRPRPRRAGRRSAPRRSPAAGAARPRPSSPGGGTTRRGTARPAMSAAVHSAPRTPSTRACACGRAHERHVQHAVEPDVVEELGASGQDPRVLATADRPADRARGAHAGRG